MSLIPHKNSEKQVNVKNNNDSNPNLAVATINKPGNLVRKRKVNILDEETFLTKLEEIIEKDFFPDLEKLKLQQAYYEAVRSNDYETVNELLSKYNDLNSSNQTPNRTPKFFETPNITKKKSNQPDLKEKPYANSEPPKKSNLSVDKYLSKNTSEDNISFEALMEDSRKKEEAKVINKWLLEKEQLMALKYTTSLELQDDDHFDDITKSIDSWPYKAKNNLMYNPEGAPLTTNEELANMKINERVINHSNTRFNSDIMNSLRRNTYMMMNNPKSDDDVNRDYAPKIGVDGKEQVISLTPKVKGYGFVDASPSPMPGRSCGDESPMMTWGEIESTPFRLDNSSTPYFSKIEGAPEFRIPDVPNRDKLLFDLEEKNNAARRKKKNDALKHMQQNLSFSPQSRKTPKSGYGSITDKINSMSPAAQQLLSVKINRKTSEKLVRSTTPYMSPKVTPKSSPYSNLNLKSPASKSSSSQSIENLRSNLKKSDKTDSITDNLLKLPKMT